jgi:hypothetical protein
MTRKTWTVLAAVVALGGVSLYLNRDWFAKPHIHISHMSARIPAFRGRPGQAPPVVKPILFGMDRTAQLTLVKVLSVQDLETNKYPHALWHLVTDSNSVPLHQFAYGMPIGGMRPFAKGTTADPLEPGVKYRIFIEAGSEKAQDDFEPLPAAAP